MDEIIDSLSPEIPLSSIFQEYRIIKEINHSWWDRNRGFDARSRNLLNTKTDELEEIKREGWVVAYNAEKSGNEKLRVLGARLALDAIEEQNRILGFAGASINQLEISEQTKKVIEEIKRLKEMAGSGRQ